MFIYADLILLLTNFVWFCFIAFTSVVDLNLSDILAASLSKISNMWNLAMFFLIKNWLIEIGGKSFIVGSFISCTL